MTLDELEKGNEINKEIRFLKEQKKELLHLKSKVELSDEWNLSPNHGMRVVLRMDGDYSRDHLIDLDKDYVIADICKGINNIDSEIAYQEVLFKNLCTPDELKIK